MFSHVLVSLDYSSLSEKALPYALELVPPDGKLTLLIAIEDLRNFPVYPSENVPIFDPRNRDETQEELVHRAKLYLEQVTSELPKPLPEIEHMVVVGPPADVIIDFAEGAHVDAIVMCTHGRTGLSRWLVGSITQKVLNAAPCPLLVVPGREKKAEAD